MPASLKPSGKRNSIMAKAMGLIFSLFNVALSQDVPFGTPQYVQCTHHGLTFVLLCVPFLFADSPRCQFAVAQCMAFLQYICKRESSIFSIVTGLNAETILILFFICNAVCNRLKIAENSMRSDESIGTILSFDTVCVGSPVIIMLQKK